jgi:hypothetical protein
LKAPRPALPRLEQDLTEACHARRVTRGDAEA